MKLTSTVPTKQSLARFVVIAFVAAWLAGCELPSDPVTESTSQSTAEQTSSTLLVSVLDVGQGMSVAVVTPDAQAMLIDGGRSQERMEQAVVPYLDEQGVTALDYLVLSHPDQDHVGGLPRLLELMEVETFVDPVIPNTNQTYEEVLTTVRDLDIEPVRGRRGMDLELGSDVTASILWPQDPLLESGGEAESNNNSLVLRIAYQDVAILVPGDAEREAELDLVELDAGGELLQSDVLVVGHHGSNSSSQGPFLDAVAPDVAVVPAGFDNQYGHPHDEVLQRLRFRDVEIYRTDLDGTVEIRTDGRSITVDPLGTEATP